MGWSELLRDVLALPPGGDLNAAALARIEELEAENFRLRLAVAGAQGALGSVALSIDLDE